MPKSDLIAGLNSRPPSVVTLTLVICSVWSGSLHAQTTDGGNWGNISGRLVFDGEVPAPEKLVVTRDEEVCGPLNLVDESLVVHPENKGLRFVAVWIDSRTEVPMHPDLKAFPEKPPVLDNKSCRFEPRMMSLRSGQPVEFSNSDPVAHNVAFFGRRNQPFSEVISATQPLKKSFPRPELLPVRVDCSIHAWMKSWIIVTDHPYVAISDKDGRFQMKNVPAGEWKLHFWHERSGSKGHIQQMRQSGRDVKLDNGNWTLKVEANVTLDLGELRLAAIQFAAKK